MRISDWSSDVCSSDLRNGRVGRSHVYLLLPASLPAGVTKSSRTAIVSIRATSPAGTHVMRRVDGSQTVKPRSLRSIRNWSRMGEPGTGSRSEEHTSELQSLMRISYAVFCLKKKTNQ